VRIILEQQVSLASALAAFERLQAASPGVDPADFLQFDDAELKRIGFSRQKAGYCRLLAAELVSGRLDLEELERLEDDRVRQRLVQLKGIGPWSAEIYLLMALRRPDAWPPGDLALHTAARRAFTLPQTPTSEEMGRMAEAWRPYRAVAARLLWHDYLSHKRDKD
jgi:DNA-3-methyladenine glycosylase II